VVVSNSMLIGNSANAEGGAVYNYGSLLDANSQVIATNGASLKLINSVISGSSSKATYQYCYTGTASVQVLNCTISDALENAMDGVGSTVIVDIVNSTLTSGIKNGSFSGTQSSNSARKLNLTNSTVSVESGIAIENSGALRIINSSIRLNAPDQGSMCLLNTGLLEIDGTILDAGSSGRTFYDTFAATVVSLGYNIGTDDARGHFLTNTTALLNTDPMLSSLQDNGGPTLTHALLPGSPAIDSGKNFSGSATDQRGFARTFNIAGIPNAVGSDSTAIGAVESQDASLRLVNFGIVSNQFGFNLIGPFANLVVEACTNVDGPTGPRFPQTC
jgi:hypothetical protein